MPNRVVKETIRTSKKVNSITDFEFRLWVYLITYVDDFGRGSADPELLKGLVFPRRKDISEDEIQNALTGLTEAGMIVLYEFDGEPFFYFPNWGKHQRIQTKKSKFPEPDDGILLPSSTVTHGESRELTVDYGDSPLRARVMNPIQSNTNPIQYESETEEITLVLNDGSEYAIKEEDIREWKKTFPDLDVMQQLRAMKLWCKDNPNKRKTRSGIRKFVSNWLLREQSDMANRKNVPQVNDTPKPPPDWTKRERISDAELRKELAKWAD